MQIKTKNSAVDKLIRAQRRPDGQIAEGVYIAMQYNVDTAALTHLWIGTPECGPMIAYHEGSDGQHLPPQFGGDYIPDDGGWTPIYSRGNYGREYACGGQWSGHTRNLINTRLIGTPPRGDIVTPAVALDRNTVIELPPGSGIQGDVTKTDIDCSGSWAVFFPSARAALSDALTAEEIQQAVLPPKTKAHLSNTKKITEARERIAEVISAFEL